MPTCWCTSATAGPRSNGTRRGWTRKEHGRFKAAFARSHSEVGSVSRIAAAARAGRLVLTHLLPTEEDGELAEAARREYAGPVIVARDGIVVEV